MLRYGVFKTGYGWWRVVTMEGLTVWVATTQRLALDYVSTMMTQGTDIETAI